MWCVPRCRTCMMMCLSLAVTRRLKDHRGEQDRPAGFDARPRDLSLNSSEYTAQTPRLHRSRRGDHVFMTRFTGAVLIVVMSHKKEKTMSIIRWRFLFIMMDVGRKLSLCLNTPSKLRYTKIVILMTTNYRKGVLVSTYCDGRQPTHKCQVVILPNLRRNSCFLHPTPASHTSLRHHTHQPTSPYISPHQSISPHITRISRITPHPHIIQHHPASPLISCITCACGGRLSERPQPGSESLQVGRRHQLGWPGLEPRRRRRRGRRTTQRAQRPRRQGAGR